MISAIIFKVKGWQKVIAKILYLLLFVWALELFCFLMIWLEFQLRQKLRKQPVGN